MCQPQKHNITDFLTKDVQEVNTVISEIESEAQESLEKRGKGEKPLVIKRDKLKAKLSAVEAQLQRNEASKLKLRAIIVSCNEMKLLPPANKVSSFVRKNLDQKLKEVKEEMKLAKKKKKVCF